MDFTEMIISKALQSKKDGRMATFISVDENDNVVLEMEKLGERRFPKGVVEQGFVAHLDNESLVKGFVERHLSRTDVPCDDAMVYKMACATHDIMSRRFKDLTNIECYKAIRGLLPEQD